MALSKKGVGLTIEASTQWRFRLRLLVHELSVLVLQFHGSKPLQERRGALEKRSGINALVKWRARRELNPWPTD